MAPRLPKSAPRSAASTAAEAGYGHNSEAMEEAERVQLISFVAKATRTGGEVADARAPYDAAKKSHNQVFALARAANPDWTRKYIEKKMEEMARSPAENVRIKAMETRHDRWLGILTPEQQKMHLEPNTPQETRDEVDWESRGYSVGLRGMDPKLPEGIPPRMDQPFLKGHEVGYGQYMAAMQANVPGANRLSVAAQAAADFTEDEPEVDIAAEARKLKNNPEFMARGEPETDAVV